MFAKISEKYILQDIKRLKSIFLVIFQSVSMLSVEKLKCPRCGKLVLKKVLVFTEGKCNNCGYFLTNSITKFIAAKIPVRQ